jgi:3-oxoacyl-[acyl-carrier protein] reductase
VGRFTDRVAIITGAGAPDGIGAAVARQLVAEGARVVLGATSDRIHDRAAELGDAAVGVIADLTVDGSAESLVDAAVQRWGRLDIVVNNAGMTSVSSGWDADDDVAGLSLQQWDAAIARNLTTAFLMCRAAVPVLTAAGYGRIVSVGSTTGTVNAMPGQSTYTAAKAGLVGLSRALALEVVGDGVTVNVVAPGYVATGSQLPFEAAAAAAGPIGRSGTPTRSPRVCCSLRTSRRRSSPARCWSPTAGTACPKPGRAHSLTTSR